MSREQRASRQEIFAHLRGLLGEEAVQIAEEVAQAYLSGKKKTALKMLKKYDATLGGVGIYASEGRKMPGIYRAFFYVELPMMWGYAAEDGRFMIHSACGYLEELIKEISWLWPWEVFRNSRPNGLPLGAPSK